MIKPTKIRPEAENWDPTALVGFSVFPQEGPQPPPTLTQTQMQEYAYVITMNNALTWLCLSVSPSELSCLCLSVTRCFPAISKTTSATVNGGTASHINRCSPWLESLSEHSDI